MTGLIASVVLQASVLSLDAHRYDVAYHQSAQNGRPLLVLLGAKWCPACVKMKQSILPKVFKSCRLKNVELAYVDYDQERELASRLARGEFLPQLIRFEKTPSGWKRKQLIGAQSPDKVCAFIRGTGSKKTNTGLASFWSMKKK